MLDNSGLNTSKKKIFENKSNVSHQRMSSHSSQKGEPIPFKDSPQKNFQKNKENDDNSSLYDLKVPLQPFNLPPTYRQDKQQLKHIENQESIDLLHKNPKYEGHPLDQSMEDSQKFRSKEMDILRRKNQDLDRENLHLKKELIIIEEKLKKGFDQEKEIIEKLQRIPKDQAYSKIRELMKEINYWQERFSQSEAKLEEYRPLPARLQELDYKLSDAINEKVILKRTIEETREKLNLVTNQKSRIEGEITGKGAQLSKLNELEIENAAMKAQVDDWKSKFEKLTAKYSDKNSIEAKYNQNKTLLAERETRMKSLVEEINRLNNVILEKKVENDKLKGRAGRLDEIQLIYQKERESRENEIKALRYKLGDDGSPKKKIRNIAKEYDIKIAALEAELTRTVEDRKLKVLENENLKKDLGDLRVELSLKEDLNDEIKEKDERISATMDEIKRLNDVLGFTVTSHEKNEVKLAEYENKIIMLTTEIQRLNQMLRGKNEENDLLKLRFGEMDSKFQSQKEKYEDQIKQNKLEIEKFKSKLKTFEAAKALEINHLKIKLDDFKKTDIQTFTKEEIKGNIEQKLQKSRIYDKEPIEDVKRRMKIEMMNLDERNRFLKEDNEHIRRQADNWREELERIEQENALLRARFGEKPELNENQQRNVLMQSEHIHRIASESNQAMLKLIDEIRDLKDRLFQKDAEVKSLNELVYRLDAENREMLNKLPEIQRNEQNNIRENQRNEQNNMRINENREIYNKLPENQRNEQNNMRINERVERPKEGNFVAFEELEQLRLENNDLKARMQYMAEPLEMLQRKYNDLERLYQTQKNMTSQHYNEIDSLQRAHSEHRLMKSNLERDHQGLERAYEEIKYRYAQLELEAKRNVQRSDGEWHAKYQLLENDAVSRYNKLEAEWNANFQNAERQWKIEYDKLLIDIRAKEKFDETYEARTREYEEKIALYAAECEKLKQIIVDKEEEIQDVKGKFGEIEALDKQEMQNNIGKLKQMLELKLNELDMTSMRVQELQRDMEDNKDYEGEIRKLKDILEQKLKEVEGYKEKSERGDQFLEDRKVLEGELIKMTKILENKIDENEEWKDKHQRLEGLLYEKGGLEAKCLDNEDKQLRLHNELDRLMRESRQKSQENEQILRKLRNMEIAMNDSINLQNEILRLKNILEEKLEEIDGWKSKCSRFEAILGDKGSLEARIPEYDRKIEVLAKDMEKLGYVYREKARENEELKVLLARQDSQISDRSLLEGEIRKLKDILESKLQELDNTKARNSALELALASKDGSEIRFREYEDKLRLVTSELEKLSQLLREKNEENEAWRVKWSRIEGNIRDREVLEGELRKMKGILEYKLQEIEQMKALNSKYELKLTEGQQIEGRIKEYEGKMQFLHQELEKMSHLLKNKHEEAEGLRLKCQRYETGLRDEEVLSAEFTRMKDILERKLQEIDDWKAKCSQYEVLLSEAKNEEPRRKETENKLDLLTREIEKLSNALREKMGEIEEWRVRYSRLESNVRDREGLEIEIIRLKELLQGKLKELDDWKSRYGKLEVYVSENSGLQARIEDYEGKIITLSKELERLGQALQMKISECDEARTRVSRLETVNRDGDVLEKELRNMKEIVGVKLLENDDLRTNNSRLEFLLSEKGNYDGKMREYEDKISLLANELEKLSRYLREKTEENEELRNHLAKQDNGNRDKDFINNEIIRLKEILSLKLTEIEELRQKLSQIPQLKQELKVQEANINSLNGELMKYNQQIIPEKTHQIENLKLRALELEGILNEKDGKFKDLSKTREIINEKNKEIEGFKETLAGFERNKLIEMENLRKILESKRIAHVETNVRANINQMDDFKEKLKQALLEAEQWRFQCHKVEANAELEAQRYKQREIELSEIYRKNEILSNELSNVKEELRMIAEEKEKLRKNKEEIELKVGLLENEKMSFEQESVKMKGHEYEELRLELEEQRKKNEFLLENLEKLSPEFQNKIDENERLKEQLHACENKNINMHQPQVSSAEQFQIIDNLKHENEALIKERDFFAKEIERNHVHQPQASGAEQYQIIDHLKHENEALTKERDFFAKEIERNLQEQERLKQEFENSLMSEDNYKDLEGKIRFLQKDLEAKSIELEKWKVKYQDLEKDINNYGKRSHGYTEDFNINHQINELQIENKRLEEILLERTEELERLVKTLEVIRNDNEKLRADIELLKAENEGLRAQMHGNPRIEAQKQYKQEVDDMKNLLQNKQNEVERLKKGLQEIGALYQKNIGNLERKLGEKGNNSGVLESNDEEVKRLRKEVEELREKKLDLELELMGRNGLDAKLTHYQDMTLRLNEQINQLKNEILTKEIEISGLKEKIMNLEHENFLSSLRKKDSMEDINFSARKAGSAIKEKKEDYRFYREEDKNFEKPAGFE